MIIRIFTIQIHSELREEFEPAFADISVHAVESQPGFISCSIGRPTQWQPDQYVMISTWENEDALVSFAGEDWNRPVIPEGMEKYVIECWVNHYELFM